MKNTVLRAFHDVPMAQYPRYFKTYRKVRERFTWKGLKSDVVRYVRECPVCQQNKQEHTYPAGLFQPLPIPNRKWECLLMDFITGLPKAQGRDCIYVVVDRLTKYAHFFPISTTYSATQVAELFFREVFRLHGLPRSIVSDRDSWFLSHFWQELFRLCGTELTPSTSYHPQTDGQTEIVNKWVEGYLRNYIAGHQKGWVKWIHLCEYCYNTTHHLSIQMSPFMALYGYEVPNFLDLLLSDSRVPSAGDLLQENQDIMRALRENIQKAQNQRKQYADQRRVERSFEVGDMVYLMLQPYRQSTLRKSGAKKLKPRYYEPFSIIRRVGEVAYELDLPANSRVHNVFHVSRLKKALGHRVVPSTALPPLDDEGKLILVLEAILDVRQRQLQRRVIRKYLIKSKDLPVEDATWESEDILQHPELRLLGDKQFQGGWTVMSPSNQTPVPQQISLSCRPSQANGFGQRVTWSSTLSSDCSIDPRSVVAG